MNKSLYIASHLLSVDSRKGSEKEGRIRTFPVLLGFINLFFCAYMDHYLKQDVDGHYVAMLLFIECAVMVLIAIGTFSRSGAEILSKTSIFPTTQWSRLLFVATSFARKPAIVAIWLTTSLFFVVFFYTSLIMASTSVLAFGILSVNVLLLVAAVSVRLVKSSQPVAGLAILSMFVITVLLATGLVFHFTVLIASLPILSWAVNGIIAAERLQIATALIDCFYMFGSCVILLYVGKKLA